MLGLIINNYLVSELRQYRYLIDFNLNFIVAN